MISEERMGQRWLMHSSGIICWQLLLEFQCGLLLLKILTNSKGRKVHSVILKQVSVEREVILEFKMWKKILGLISNMLQN